MEEERKPKAKESELRTETVEDLISRIRSDSDFRDLESVATKVGRDIDSEMTIEKLFN